MAISGAGGLAGAIADWIRQRGLTPAGTVATPAAAATTSEMPAPESAPAPPEAPAPRADRTPPFPAPQSNVERMYNAAQQIQWQIDDVQQLLNRLTPDEEYKRPKLQDDINTLLARLTTQQQAIANAEKAAVETTGKNPPQGQTRTRVERAPAPDSRLFRITEVTDGYGNWSYQNAEPIEGSQPQGAAEDRALELQTAQVNLQRLQQQLAREQDPLTRQQLQLQVQTAQQQLEQARARAPLDLRLQELGVQQAEQNLNRPSVQTVGGRAVGINPLTGERTFSTDLLSPEERAQQEEADALQREAARRGPLPQNAYAALSQERTRLRAAGEAEIARLQELQRQGALSAADAERQWQQWVGPRQAQLAGLQTAAEEAQRLEQQRTDELQRAEDARVQALNRQREETAYTAGEGARQTWMGLAPQVRTPQFLQQYGQSVANMAARAAAPSAEAAAALPRGSTFTADTFNPAHFRGAIPNLDEVARLATARALAAISPVAAATINRPMPRFPAPVDLPGMVAQVPYRGPLTGVPSPASGLLPTPGMNPALDIGGGMARTPYGPTGSVFLDWPIHA